MRDTKIGRASWGWECVSIALKGTQQLRTKTHESDDFRTNGRLDRPFGPFLRIHLKIKMHEAVSQRGRHAGRDTPVRIAVASSNNGPSFREGVLAQFAVEHQLVTAGLHHGWRSVQLVKEENS